MTNTRDIKWTSKVHGEIIQTNKGQNDYRTASEEDDTDAEGGTENKRQLIRGRHNIEEKVMRVLRKLNVSYNLMMSGMANEEDLTIIGGTNESYNNPEISQEA